MALSYIACIGAIGFVSTLAYLDYRRFTDKDLAGDKLRKEGMAKFNKNVETLHEELRKGRNVGNKEFLYPWNVNHGPYYNADERKYISARFNDTLRLYSQMRNRVNQKGE